MRIAGLVLLVALLAGGVAGAQEAPLPRLEPLEGRSLPAPLPVPESTAEPLSLNLAEALRLALMGSPRVDVSLARLKEAREQAEGAASPARLQGRVTLLGDQNRTTVGPPRVVSTPDGIQTQQDQPFDYFRGGALLGLRQVIFDGGKVLARVEQMKALADGQAQEAVEEWHALALEVRVAYLDVLEALAVEEASREGLEAARLHLRVAEARFGAGQAPRADVLAARVPLAEAEVALAQASGEVVQSGEALCRLLGLPLETPLKLAEPEVPEDPPGPLSEALSQALERRAALRAARLRLEAARRGEAAAEMEDNPHLDAYADVVGAAFGGDAAASAGYRVGVDLQWPLLDGTRTRHEIRAARARTEKAEAQVRDLEVGVEQEVRQAYRAVGLAAAAFESGGVQVERAREALRVAEAQYRAGFGPFYPLRDARRDLVAARAARAGAFYDYLRARASLAHAMGEDPPARLEARPEAGTGDS